MPISRLTILGILFCFSLSAKAGGTNNTQEFVLENGLKLIVREDHRAPLVVTQVWYRVGGSFEPLGYTGISHALEHMMFRGTPRFPADTFSRLISVQGGDQNAFTAKDFTAYHQELNKELLNVCFELEADRMINLELNPAVFEKELKVVMEERRLRTDDNPEQVAEERFLAAAHISNPYRNPVVGWMNDIQHLKVEDLKTWYKTWYGPNNAVIVVVGDVKAPEVFKIAEKYFGFLKPVGLPRLNPRKESLPLGTRSLQVNLKAAVPRLFMGYNVPSIKTTEDPLEPYALTVLLMALDGGESSRFSQNLIRGQNLASNIRSYYNPFQLHETLFYFSANPTRNHTLEELEQGFEAQIRRLQSELLSEQELQRIKVKAVAQHIFERDSMFAQAVEIGAFEAIGLSWKLSDLYPEQIQKVTALQVQQVAKKYFTPERLTTARLIPLKSGT